MVVVMLFMSVDSSEVPRRLGLGGQAGLFPGALSIPILKRYRAGLRTGQPGGRREAGSHGALLSELHVILDGRDAADAARVRQRLLYVGLRSYESAQLNSSLEGLDTDFC
jgi:hypothetical protein